MAEVVIAESLKNEILKKFKQESKIIFKLFNSLKDYPKKGKVLGRVGGIVIKELKYKSFRFYFITDGNKLKICNEEILKSILIKFVRMSEKKNQQKVINEIKNALINLGFKEF